MAVRNIKTIRPKVWIPPTQDMEFKIEVIASDGTAYDITDEIVEGEYTDGITETIGNFTFTIDNTNQDFTDKFSLYNEIIIYMDYATSATTKVFTGLLEKVSTKKEDIVVSGRSVASRVMGITVIKSYTSQYTHDILQDLLSTYATYITQTNIDTTESTDTVVTVNWSQKPFWECIQELCNRAGYDAYISADSDFNYFVSESRDNSTEAVVHDINLEEVGDFTPDLSAVYNRIIIYGAKVKGIQILWTEEDSSSINSYDVKELIINDSNIITTDQAQARALYELSIRKDPPIIGEVTSLGLATILPGERIRISDPDSNLQPGYYSIQKFIHKFSSDDVPLTVLTIKKEENTLTKVLKKRITFETESTEKENPNEMKYSQVFDFNADTGFHSNTEIISGVLKTTTGQSTGTWTSNPKIISSGNVYKIELRVNGDSVVGTDYEVSTDGGNNWTTISSPNTLILISLGANLVIRITINSANTQLKAIGILYDTQ